MVKFSSVLAGVAAAGLLVASPALAQTRAADSLPATSAVLDPAAVDRSASPVEDASELAGFSPFLIILFLAAAIGLIVIISGGGNDSPG